MSTARGERLQVLHRSRERLFSLPCDAFFELPGRPNVMFCIRDYTQGDKAKGAEAARGEVPFLFKAFETGQIGPRRLARMGPAERPRNTTIHEYLDWTVTAVEAREDGDYDFSGFRVVVLYPRERIMWPAPGQYDKEGPQVTPLLGAPKPPIPQLMIKQGSSGGFSLAKPLSAATIRAGPDYLEVPFVATHEAKRGRGYGRAVVEAIEQIARAVHLPRIMLCSTKEESVQNTWLRLGFSYTSEEEMGGWDIHDSDMVHMQNTVQMTKLVPQPRRWRALTIRHRAFVARMYVPLDGGGEANGLPPRAAHFMPRAGVPGGGELNGLQQRPQQRPALSTPASQNCLSGALSGLSGPLSGLSGDGSEGRPRRRSEDTAMEYECGSDRGTGATSSGRAAPPPQKGQGQQRSSTPGGAALQDGMAGGAASPSAWPAQQQQHPPPQQRQQFTLTLHQQPQQQPQQYMPQYPGQQQPFPPQQQLPQQHLQPLPPPLDEDDLGDLILGQPQHQMLDAWGVLM